MSETNTMIRPPEDLCYRKLQKKNYQKHLQSLKTATAMTDSSVPKSYTLTHLKNKGKKDQMRRDRLNHIAKTDRILKKDIEKIMFTEREQSRFEPMDSLNGKQRAKEMKYLEKNNLYMYTRLNKIVPSVPTKKELAKSYERHLEESYLMSRKHFGVLESSSPIKKKPKSLIIRQNSSNELIRQQSSGSISGGSRLGSRSRQRTPKTADSDVGPHGRSDEASFISQESGTLEDI